MEISLIALTVPTLDNQSVVRCPDRHQHLIYNYIVISGRV